MNAPVTLTPTLTVSEDGQLRYLPLETIDVQPGFNPRQFFADTEFQQLIASVRAQGIIQPIVVRPPQESPGRYWVIAGERRWRAAREARLPEDMPALVRQVDERAALLLALAENGNRDGISPAEEAQAARRLLAACEGDRDEATRLLGWTPTKFAARQLLLHAAPAVLTALAERRIKPGHAELLAGLPAPTQDGTLARVMADQISVADLKTRIAGFALDLAAAIFDKDECLACPHNSSVQAALFEEGIGEGTLPEPRLLRPQNPGCPGGAEAGPGGGVSGGVPGYRESAGHLFAAGGRRSHWGRPRPSHRLSRLPALRRAVALRPRAGGAGGGRSVLQPDLPSG